MTAQHVVIVGAGIVGAAAGIWLRRAGYEVTLLDKGRPGMGASYGNGCILARCSVVPVTAPGLTRKAPGYLADPDFPLFMRWRYAPRLIPWLVKYLGHANEEDTRRISRGLNTIVGDSLEQHQALAQGTAAEKWVHASNYSFVYADRAAFEADALAWQLRREVGFEPEIIEGPAVQEAEPILGPGSQLLAVMKDHGFIMNPGRYVQDLVKVLEDLGGRFVQAEVTDFDLSGGQGAGQISAVLTTSGRFECDRAIISSGVWSKPLMAKLGLTVPLEAERGYHIVFEEPSQKPNAPMMLTTGKLVATAMDQGLRCAGVVEFGGLSEQRSNAPLRLLRRKAQELFPGLAYKGTQEWLGFRPAPSDSLPLIGELGKSGVFSAFGHHHIGLTGGPKTGRLVADMIAGRHSNHDLSPFTPMRFAKGQ